MITLILVDLMLGVSVSAIVAGIILIIKED